MLQVMGMYDTVNVDINCPDCKSKLTFQSKSGYCMLDLIQPEEVDNFYTYCSCGYSADFSKPYKTREEVRLPPATLEQVIALGFEIKVRRNMQVKL